MKLYGDETEIKEYVQNRKSLENSIYDEVSLDGEVYTFSRKNLMNDSFSMILPEQFVEMSTEHIEYKYPSTFRPELISTDQSGGTNITFSTFPNVDKQHVKDILNTLQTASKRLSPSSVFIDKKIFTLADNQEVGYYDYRGFTFANDIYVLKFIVNIGETTILGGFSCIWGEHQIWSLLIKQMVRTIIDNTNKEVEPVE